MSEHVVEKQWVSIGLVEGSAGDSPVEFSVEGGQVYVNVELQPSKLSIRARVGGATAGAGEGEYFPFLPGDEVLVVCPEGREDNGSVIISRLNNVHDKFPMDSVAGQDPTTNTFAFRRRRTPYVEEFAGPVTLRNALTGALLSLDSKGNATLRDGEGAALQLAADALTLQGPSDPSTAPRLLFQLNVTEERGILQVGDAQLLLNSSKTNDGSYLTIPGSLTVSLGANQPAEHVATVEFVLAVLELALAAIGGGFGVPAVLALQTLIATGQSALSPLMQTALGTGLPIAAAANKPPALGGLQIAPGLGAVFFRTG